jgi:hypothetical protein
MSNFPQKQIKHTVDATKNKENWHDIHAKQGIENQICRKDFRDTLELMSMTLLQVMLRRTRWSTFNGKKNTEHNTDWKLIT